MSITFAYDLTRLFLGPLFPTPRGIDRVDLALARHVFAADDVPHLGVLPTPWGVRAYRARTVRRLLGRVERLWREDVAAAADRRLDDLIAGILRPGSPATLAEAPARFGLARSTWRMGALLSATGLPPGRAVRRAVPRGATYINLGQLGLAVPAFHRWLGDRRDVTAAIMLHDVIPLDYPHLVSEAAAGHHARMVRTAARHADCLLFNSACTRDGVAAALAPHGRGTLPSLVRALPLPGAYLAAQASPESLAGVRYCITVSTIEPRKNHDLLIRVWRRLAAQHGSACPHLVVVGAHGKGATRLRDTVAGERGLAARVHFVSGLSSPALASLVLGAEAMLCPSLAEGFGLPLLEGRALGVPVIASDIAAHREIAGPAATLLATDDDAGWERAVAALAPRGRHRCPPVAAELTEAAWCADVLRFLEGVRKPNATDRPGAALGHRLSSAG